MAHCPPAPFQIDGAALGDLLKVADFDKRGSFK